MSGVEEIKATHSFSFTIKRTKYVTDVVMI